MVGISRHQLSVRRPRLKSSHIANTIPDANAPRNLPKGAATAFNERRYRRLARNSRLFLFLMDKEIALSS